MKQYPLALDSKQDYSLASFFVTEANSEAFELVKSWPKSWGAARGLVICGQEGSGKTHLANILASISKNSCYIIDPLEEYLDDEQALFHALSRYAEENKQVLITTKTRLADIKFKTADVASRVKSMLFAEIKVPDETLLKAIIQKNLSDRGLKINKDALDYTVARIERSYGSVLSFVNKLDSASLVQQRNITIPFIREVILL